MFNIGVDFVHCSLLDFVFENAPIISSMRLNFVYTFDDGAVTIRIKMIFFIHGVLVSLLHSFRAGNGANEHKQG